MPPREEELVQVVSPVTVPEEDAGEAPAVGEDGSTLEELRLRIEALKSRDPSRRLAAARLLGRAGPPAVPLLLEALAGATGRFREAIVSALGLIGPKARAALPSLEALCEDEEVGATARRAVGEIRRGWALSWERLVEVVLPWMVWLLFIGTVVGETASWVGLFGRMEGLGLQVAVAWGCLGAVAGAVFGINCGSGWVARRGAQYLGVVGACAGAVLGRWAGVVVEPLVQALTR